MLIPIALLFTVCLACAPNALTIEPKTTETASNIGSNSQTPDKTEYLYVKKHGSTPEHLHTVLLAALFATDGTQCAKAAIQVLKSPYPATVLTKFMVQYNDKIEEEYFPEVSFILGKLFSNAVLAKTFVELVSGMNCRLVSRSLFKNHIVSSDFTLEVIERFLAKYIPNIDYIGHFDIILNCVALKSAVKVVWIDLSLKQLDGEQVMQIFSHYFYPHYTLTPNLQQEEDNKKLDLMSKPLANALGTLNTVSHCLLGMKNGLYAYRKDFVDTALAWVAEKLFVVDKHDPFETVYGALNVLSSIPAVYQDSFIQSLHPDLGRIVTKLRVGTAFIEDTYGLGIDMQELFKTIVIGEGLDQFAETSVNFPTGQALARVLMGIDLGLTKVERENLKNLEQMFPHSPKISINCKVDELCSEKVCPFIYNQLLPSSSSCSAYEKKVLTLHSHLIYELSVPTPQYKAFHGLKGDSVLDYSIPRKLFRILLNAVFKKNSFKDITHEQRDLVLTMFKVHYPYFVNKILAAEYVTRQDRLGLLKNGAFNMLFLDYWVFLDVIPFDELLTAVKNDPEVRKILFIHHDLVAPVHLRPLLGHIVQYAPVGGVEMISILENLSWKQPKAMSSIKDYLVSNIPIADAIISVDGFFESLQRYTSKDLLLSLALNSNISIEHRKAFALAIPVDIAKGALLGSPDYLSLNVAVSNNHMEIAMSHIISQFSSCYGPDETVVLQKLLKTAPDEFVYTQWTAEALYAFFTKYAKIEGKTVFGGRMLLADVLEKILYCHGKQDLKWISGVSGNLLHALRV